MGGVIPCIIPRGVPHGAPRGGVSQSVTRDSNNLQQLAQGAYAHLASVRTRECACLGSLLSALRAETHASFFQGPPLPTLCSESVQLCTCVRRACLPNEGARRQYRGRSTVRTCVYSYLRCVCTTRTLRVCACVLGGRRGPWLRRHVGGAVQRNNPKYPLPLTLTTTAGEAQGGVLTGVTRAPRPYRRGLYNFATYTLRFRL